MAGIEIGRKTLVGAGAVVTKSLPENVIAFGVPAYIQAELTEEENFAQRVVARFLWLNSLPCRYKISEGAMLSWIAQI
jgi:serine acetyltransferase